MQNQVTVSSRHVAAIAIAMAAVALAASNLMPRAAIAAPAVAAAAEPTMHDAVDWTRVVAAPVDTGATVGAYNR